MIVGRSPAMLEVYKQIGRVAAMDTPVLLVGDSGTGKEVVARAIHDNSRAAEVGFFPINCAAIPDTLLESELFGYEKGAFTGAAETRRGLFEAAEGGTVFLDEIGDMPRLLQGKLLRVLQQKVIQRLGSHREHPVHFRLIAATHQNLEKMVAEGTFRQDLYHRLAGLKLRLPRLAERSSDVALLANYFLQLYAHEFQLSHAAIEQEAVRLLENQPWPGNVRQLQNVIRTALLHSRNLGINRRAIELALAQNSAEDRSSGEDALGAWLMARLAAENLDETRDLHLRLVGDFERRLLEELGRRLEYNRTRMAAALGISRLTLRRRMAACGLLAGNGEDR
jgi:DNA-binding NtrC family response regulator